MASLAVHCVLPCVWLHNQGGCATSLWEGAVTEVPSLEGGCSDLTSCGKGAVTEKTISCVLTKENL